MNILQTCFQTSSRFLQCLSNFKQMWECSDYILKIFIDFHVKFYCYNYNVLGKVLIQTSIDLLITKAVIFETVTCIVPFQPWRYIMNDRIHIQYTNDLIKGLPKYHHIKTSRKQFAFNINKILSSKGEKLHTN